MLFDERFKNRFACFAMLGGIQSGEMRLTPCMNDVMVIFRAFCLVLECESFVNDSDVAHDIREY